MKNKMNTSPDQLKVEYDNQWRQTATEGQWISNASEDAMNFETDDDDAEEGTEYWEDVDPQPGDANEPHKPS
jgi:hypothetical protein